MFAWLGSSAQSVVRGVVLERSTSNPLQNAEILIAGTTTGSSTDDKGAFQLDIGKDTATIVVRSVGYQTQRLLVHSHDSVAVRMRVECIVDYFYRPYVEARLVSGVRNTPFGGQATLFWPYLLHNSYMQPAARIALGYQTGRSSIVRSATIGIDELIASCNVNVDLAAEYQYVQLNKALFAFERLSLGGNFSYGNRMLPIWLALGEARIIDGEYRYTRAGLEVGSQYRFGVLHKQYFELTSRVGWWQKQWQWQSILSTLFRTRYTCAVSYQQVGQRYKEINLSVGIRWFR